MFSRFFLFAASGARACQRVERFWKSSSLKCVFCEGVPGKGQAAGTVRQSEWGFRFLTNQSQRRPR
jgi:hypothetical protein